MYKEKSIRHAPASSDDLRIRKSILETTPQTKKSDEELKSRMS